MWLAIIESLVAALAPLLEKFLLAWLSQALHVAALNVPEPTSVGADDKANKLVLLDKVRDSLWFFQFAKINAVEAAIAKVKLS